MAFASSVAVLQRRSVAPFLCTLHFASPFLTIHQLSMYARSLIHLTITLLIQTAGIMSYSSLPPSGARLVGSCTTGLATLPASHFPDPTENATPGGHCATLLNLFLFLLTAGTTRSDHAASSVSHRPDPIVIYETLAVLSLRFHRQNNQGVFLVRHR